MIFIEKAPVRFHTAKKAPQKRGAIDEKASYCLVILRLRVLRDCSNLQPVKKAQTKQMKAEPIKTTCMPSRKISGRLGMSPVTRYPAFALMTLNNVVVATEIPTTIPTFRTSELTLPTTPSIDLGAVDMTNELLGDWKSPLPSPSMATRNPTRVIELPS